MPGWQINLNVNVVRDRETVNNLLENYPVKRHRGEPGHTRDTRDTRAHAGTRITRTNLTTIHPNRSGHKPARKPHGSHGRTSQPSTQTQRHKPARKPRPTQQPQEQPQARSRPVSVERHRGEPGHKKTPGGAGTHTGHTGDEETGHTGARRGHTDHTDEPHNEPPKPNDTPTRPRDGRNRDRLNSRKNSRRPGVDRGYR